MGYCLSVKIYSTFYPTNIKNTSIHTGQVGYRLQIEKRKYSPISPSFPSTNSTTERNLHFGEMERTFSPKEKRTKIPCCKRITFKCKVHFRCSGLISDKNAKLGSFHSRSPAGWNQCIGWGCSLIWKLSWGGTVLKFICMQASVSLRADSPTPSPLPWFDLQKTQHSWHLDCNLMRS